MRSVDEGFRPVLPEPNMVSDSPQGYSQSLTVSPQYQSQTDVTQTVSGLTDARTSANMEKRLRESIRVTENLQIYEHRPVPPPCPLFCLVSFFCSWTASPSLLPDSVISPRAWTQMCFQLITHSISFSWLELKRLRRKTHDAAFFLIVLC